MLSARWLIRNLYHFFGVVFYSRGEGRNFLRNLYIHTAIVLRPFVLTPLDNIYYYYLRSLVFGLKPYCLLSSIRLTFFTDGNIIVNSTLCWAYTPMSYTSLRLAPSAETCRSFNDCYESHFIKCICWTQ